MGINQIWCKFSLSLAALTMVSYASAVSAAPTAINFWHGIGASDGQILNGLIAKFQKQNPQIKIQQQVLGWDQMYEKLVVSLAANKPPDVYVIHPEEFYWFEKTNAMQPLNPFVNGPNGIPQKDWVPGTWSVVQSGSKILGIPLNIHNYGMFINTELFAQSGLDPGSPPETGTEFLAAAKKLTKLKADGRNIEKYGFIFSNLRYNYLTLLAQSGTTLLNEDKTKATFNCDAGIKPLYEMLEWKRLKIADYGDMDAFLKGRGAMNINGTWNLETLTRAKGLKWAPAVVPAFGPKKGTWASAHIMCIPPNIRGKRLQAAWSFIKWLSDHSNEWCRDSGHLPVRSSYLNSAEFKALPLQSTFGKMLPYSVYEPSVRRQTDVRVAFDTMIVNSVEGKGDPKQLAARAADQIDRIQQKYR